MKKRLGIGVKRQRMILNAGMKGVMLVGMLFISMNTIQAQDTSLKVQYGFNSKSNTDTIIDETGNGYNARMIGSAQIKKLGKFSLLQIGSTSGYADMGAKMGDIISSLSNFTISTYLYIDPSVVLTNNGNFVWSFSNSADIASVPTGCMFYSAKQSRYAICPTNYTTERQVSIGTTGTKGEWTHITYTQSGTTGTVYIDGVQRRTGTISVLPSALGATPFNYLGKSAYAQDQLLLNSMYSDFRIYNRALTAAQVADLSTNIATLDTLIYTEQAAAVATALSLGDLNAVLSNLSLPPSLNETTIQWNSSNTAVITNSGVVTRPASGSDTVEVQLTATITRNFISVVKTFTASVIPYYTDQVSVQMDADSLRLNGNLTNLRSNLTLPQAGAQGTIISWSSDIPTVLSNTGAIINRPANGSGNTAVTLTALIKKGGVTAQKKFTISVAEDEGFSAYLFAYFTGNNISQEAIRFATSSDALVYKALNNDNPVISSAAISSSGGIRDPHIVRGEDGKTFYMVATDMVSALGWNSNRAMVLLKSTNLIDWQSSIINIPNTYPEEFGSVDRVWAPETIYDPVAGKYMVYFSLRKGSTDYDKIYYAYANSDFTALEGTPKQLFYSPTNSACIDGNIIVHNGKYHLFFKTEGSGNGIKKAVSDKLTEGYVIYDKYLDQNSNAVEGGCVFRLYNSDSYILMYDVYSSGYYEFTKSTDLENFSVISGMSMDFTPRHGTVIPITKDELDALNAKWNPSGVAVEKANDAFSIYPVPAKDNLNIVLNESGRSDVLIAVYNMVGSKVLQKDLSQQKTQINISGLVKGMYIIKCTQDNVTIGNARFIVE